MLLTSRVRGRVRYRFGVWSVRGYAHVFVLAYPVFTASHKLEISLEVTRRTHYKCTGILPGP